MPAPDVGEKLGKYRLLEVVGEGGMASVYRATDEDLGREVAVKVLHPHLEKREDARRRFRREAMTIARISHPNIVSIYDYSGDDAEASFIVTQFIRGPHLGKLHADSGPFPAELAAAIARQVAEGLMVAHSAGIVHRDVKPENILVPSDGVLKIADFGIVHITDTQDMTVTGQILGSPYYMSPEHVLGKGLDARADVFSFGSLLFFLVTGKLAFEGPNPHAVLKRICEGEVVQPERLAPAAGRAMSDIILSCLEKDPACRPPDLAPVARALDAYLAAAGVGDPVAEVARFLGGPDAYRRDAVPRTVSALLGSAGSLREEGRMTEAMDALNRVLCLDPGNREAMARVSETVQAGSRRRLATRLGVLLCAIALVVAGVVGVPRVLAAFGLGRPGSGGETAPDAGAPIARGAAADAGSDPGDAPPGPVASMDPPDAGTVDVLLKPNVIKALKKLPEATAAGSGAKATVKFVPIPKTVVVWVDGKKLGDYFNHQTAELTVGKHTILFEPEDPDCCEPAEWEVVVLPAAADGRIQAIGQRLSLKPATLLVSSDKPAKILIDGKEAGHAGKPLTIPMEGDPVRKVTVTVSAEGYAPVTIQVKLQAGKSSSPPAVKLEPAA
mgnify:CR=1 FL=1